eukprot:373024-Prymnesium_polylepis.1
MLRRGPLSACNTSGPQGHAERLFFRGAVLAKAHAVPEQTGTGRQSGGFSPGLGLGVPAEGRDWMGL